MKTSSEFKDQVVCPFTPRMSHGQEPRVTQHVNSVINLYSARPLHPFRSDTAACKQTWSVPALRLASVTWCYLLGQCGSFLLAGPSADFACCGVLFMSLGKWSLGKISLTRDTRCSQSVKPLFETFLVFMPITFWNGKSFVLLTFWYAQFWLHHVSKCPTLIPLLFAKLNFILASF